MKTWTAEQYEERDRVMREAVDIPLSGSEPGLGYVGSRECIADIQADSLYERRAMMLAIARDIIKDITSNPPAPMHDLHNEIHILSSLLRQEGLTKKEIDDGLDWIEKACKWLISF